MLYLFTRARFAALIEICRRHIDNPAAGRDLDVAYILDAYFVRESQTRYFKTERAISIVALACKMAFPIQEECHATS